MALNRYKFDICRENHWQLNEMTKRAIFVRRWLPLVDYEAEGSASATKEAWESRCNRFLSGDIALPRSRKSREYVVALCEVLEIDLKTWEIADPERFKRSVLNIYSKNGIRSGTNVDVLNRPTFGWERILTLSRLYQQTLRMFSLNAKRLEFHSSQSTAAMPTYQEDTPVSLELTMPFRALLVVLHKAPQLSDVTVIAPSIFVPQAIFEPGLLSLPTQKPSQLREKAYYVRRPRGVHRICAIGANADTVDTLLSYRPKIEESRLSQLSEFELGLLAGRVENCTKSHVFVNSLTFEVE